MRFALVPLAALALLAGCASNFNAKVSRFQQLPAPTGETFAIQARDPAKAGGLEFATYANMVRERLIAQGYQPASSTSSATLLVNLDYDVDQGREKVATRPGSFGYGGFGYSRYGWGPYGWGHPYGYGRFGYRGGYPFSYGSAFYDPFWGGPFDRPEVYSYTVFNSRLDMNIVRKGSNQSVFEGRAEAATRSDDLTQLVPNLVAAMFTNFPGRSGETVRVKVPLDNRRS